MHDSLHDLVCSDDAEGVRAALEAGCDPDQPHPLSGALPIRMACQSNALGSLRALLEGGANADAVFAFTSRVSKRTVDGRTALMYADTCEAARLLLEFGAGIDRADSQGWTALVHAAHDANAELVEYLLRRGASTEVSAFYDGARRGLLEFVRHRCAFLEEHAESMRQPEASENLAALRNVEDVINRFMHT